MKIFLCGERNNKVLYSLGYLEGLEQSRKREGAIKTLYALKRERERKKKVSQLIHLSCSYPDIKEAFFNSLSIVFHALPN